MRQPPQFRLAALFVFVTIVSIAMAAMFTFPWWLSLPLLFVFTCSIPAALIVIVIHRGGGLRAFAVGALVPTAIVAFWMGVYVVQGAVDLAFDQIADAALWLWISQLVVCGVGVVAGLLSMVVYRLVAETESDTEQRNDGLESPE